jgi:hypothetical protein
MDNVKIAMLAVSLLLNLYLISEQKKSTAESRFTLQGITAKVEAAMKSDGSTEASSNISDKALIDLVNQTVREEFSRAVPNDDATASTAINQRIQQLQARADALSAEIQKRAAGAGSEKEKKLREEAQKMKQEILALCVKK